MDLVFKKVKDFSIFKRFPEFSSESSICVHRFIDEKWLFYAVTSPKDSYFNNFTPPCWLCDYLGKTSLKKSSEDKDYIRNLYRKNGGKGTAPLSIVVFGDFFCFFIKTDHREFVDNYFSTTAREFKELSCHYNQEAPDGLIGSAISLEPVEFYQNYVMEFFLCRSENVRHPILDNPKWRYKIFLDLRYILGEAYFPPRRDLSLIDIYLCQLILALGWPEFYDFFLGIKKYRHNWITSDYREEVVALINQFMVKMEERFPVLRERLPTSWL